MFRNSRTFSKWPVSIGLLAICISWGSVASELEAADGGGWSGLQLRLETKMAALPEDGVVIGDPGRRSLVVLVARAHATAPELASASARIESEAARVDRFRGRLRPNVSVSTELGRGVIDDSGGSSQRLSFRSTAGQITLPLYRPRLNAELRGGAVTLEDSRLARREVSNALTLQLATTYLEVVNLREEIQFLEQERDLVRVQQHVNRRRLEGGVGSITEVDESALRLQVVETQLTTLHHDLHMQLSELRRQSGEPLADAARLQESAYIPYFVPTTLVQTQERLAKANPTLMRANLAVATAKLVLVAQSAEHLPVVDLQAYGDIGRSVSDGVYRSSSSTVSLVFSLPLYSGGSLVAAEREASAQIVRAEQDRVAIDRGLVSEMTRAWSEFKKFDERIVANTQALSTAQELARRTRKSFDAGLRTNIDVLNAQRQISDARKELSRARSGVLLSQIRILILMDEIDEEVLRRIDGVFKSR